MSLPANIQPGALTYREHKLLQRSHNRAQISTVIEQQEIILKGQVAELEIGVLMHASAVAGKLGIGLAKDLTEEAGTSLAAQRFAAAALAPAEAGVLRILGGLS